jgi:glycosyltransferase involved in cell wall biosynthesis
MTQAAPLVSVILSVYNGAADVPAAVRSILDQTFGDFELIAIDNGSFKDNTRQVLDDLARTTADPRLRIVHLDTNIGLAGALNHGIALARGTYIARQDHDDVSRPERLAKQVAYMAANPRLGLLGTRAEIWVENEPTGRMHAHPTDNASLQFDLLINNPFVHSSVMIRRSVLDDVGAYTTDPARQPPEDYELWSRIARRAEVANLPDVLLVYREMANSMSRDGPNPFRDKLITIAAENIAAAASTDMSISRAAAALAHAAYDQVGPQTDIEAVCRLIIAAARTIESRNLGADLGSRAEFVVGNLRHHHAVAVRVPAVLQPLASTLRTLPLPLALRSRLKRWMS